MLAIDCNIAQFHYYNLVTHSAESPQGVTVVSPSERNHTHPLSTYHLHPHKSYTYTTLHMFLKTRLWQLFSLLHIANLSATLVEQILFKITYYLYLAVLLVQHLEVKCKTVTCFYCIVLSFTTVAHRTVKTTPLSRPLHMLYFSTQNN